MARSKINLSSIRRNPVPYLIRPLMIEFFSQFIFTFWGVMAEPPYKEPVEEIAILGNETIAVPEPVEKDYLIHNFAPAFQTALSVFIEIILFAKMSFAPAQFNPSITTVLTVVGTVPVILYIPILITQCVASMLAAYMSLAIRGVYPATLVIPEDLSSGSVFANEVILVAGVTIFAAELTQNPKYDEAMGVFGLAMAVFMAALGARYTGVVCLSPSRAFGPAVVTGGATWNRHWLLWVSDIIGSASAGAFWLLFLAPDDRSWIGRFAKDEKEDRRSDVLMDERKEDDTAA